MNLIKNKDTIIKIIEIYKDKRITINIIKMMIKTKLNFKIIFKLLCIIFENM
jgi:hypothetical protein